MRRGVEEEQQQKVDGEELKEEQQQKEVGEMLEEEQQKIEVGEVLGEKAVNSQSGVRSDALAILSLGKLFGANIDADQKCALHHYVRIKFSIPYS